MKKTYILVFDKIIIQQLKKASKNTKIKEILSKMLTKLELTGPYLANLLDTKLFIYEVKNKHPPIRLYFKHNQKNNELYVFEFEMKTSKKKQQSTITKIKHKAQKLKTQFFSSIFFIFRDIFFKF